MLQGDCVVGPFTFERAEEAREWLNAGAKCALFTPPSLAGGEASVAETVKSEAAKVAIPGNRLILLLDPPAMGDAAAVARFAERVESLAAPVGHGCYEYCRAEKVGVVSGIA